MYIWINQIEIQSEKVNKISKGKEIFTYILRELKIIIWIELIIEDLQELHNDWKFKLVATIASWGVFWHWNWHWHWHWNKSTIHKSLK